MKRRLFSRNLLLVAVFCSALTAHPMGNFSISHYARIRLEREFIEITYLIDMAEIPTFQEIQQSGIKAGPADPSLEAYLARKAAVFAKQLDVTINRERVVLRAVSRNVIFPPGAGNLPTMKIGIVYRASVPAACNAKPCELAYRDLNFPDHAGWKEVIVTAGKNAAIKGSDVPTRDRSAMLANYPTDLLNSPPQALQARIVFATRSEVRPRSEITQQAASKPPAKEVETRTEKATNTQPAVPLQANRQGTPRNAFTDLMREQQLGWGVIFIALAIAVGLGALHALEPGHGKTIVAAYLAGSKGSARDAILLGMIVTASHTAGVYLLGGITIYAQKYIVPERLYPFLGVLSGIFIAGMGFYLVLQRLAGAEFTHTHSHGEFRHSHVVLLGVTGGIVPCPAALVVLLSAIALHRVEFGLVLIVAFSIGMAAVLIGMGLIAVYAARVMSRVPSEGLLIQRWLPLASASIITMLGCGVAIQGLRAAGILRI